jgi:hypothetical protein
MDTATIEGTLTLTGTQRQFVCRIINSMPKRKVAVKVDDLMQAGYVYFLTEPAGRNFDPDFKPELTPREMLELGVFGGKYMTDCRREFPASWFKRARLCHEQHDAKLNCFKVNASQPLSIWKKRAGFIMKIRAVGFSGIAVTTWGAGVLMTSARSNAGVPCGGT